MHEALPVRSDAQCSVAENRLCVGLYGQKSLISAVTTAKSGKTQVSATPPIRISTLHATLYFPVRVLPVNHVSLFRPSTICRAVSGLLIIAGSSELAAAPAEVRLDSAAVVHGKQQSVVEQTATQVLVEEVARRTGLRWTSATARAPGGSAVIVTTQAELGRFSNAPPPSAPIPSSSKQPEGYRITVDAARKTVWIIGADGPGTLYGVGRFLRLLDWKQGHAAFPANVDIETAPKYPVRGHQLGYRNTANSYDAWNEEQYEQYIRELSFFGANAIENIPVWSSPSPLMPIEPAQMHAAIADICRRYGMQYWIWVPATVDLEDEDARSGLLDKFEETVAGTQYLTGVFVPGGDPGDHIPRLMLPYLRDASELLKKHHPEARMWMSMQGFSSQKAQAVYDLLQDEQPDWLGGIVAGPSSRPIPELRNNVPSKYPIRLYPDLTHNKICQYPVPWWDIAYANTLGREAINPRPVQFAQIHNWFAPYTDGFLSYSDGVHDDVNKVVWSGLGWNERADVRDIIHDYARVFFSPAVAEDAADGIFALERNWRGPLRYNACVEGTYTHWNNLAKRFPQLADNWRWQMNLLRATYDAYVRRRLLHEEALEREANAALRTARQQGSDSAMQQAADILNRAVAKQAAPQLRARIVHLCEVLYQSIGLQTSVEKYKASNPERGAILDFVDIPLNNRWWLEDEFQKVRSLDSESARIDRLLTIANWESPGLGSYYDDVGHPAKSAHVRHSEQVITIHGEEALPKPMLWWAGSLGGQSRERLSSQSSMNYPEAVVYEGLDPDADYVVRCGGLGQFLLRVDGERVEIQHERAELGEARDFPVPQKHLADRKIELTWDRPGGESHLNWRQHSRLCEIWLLKQD